MAKQERRNKPWQNPEMIAENKLRGRNLALPFDEQDEYSYDTSANKLSLNGPWKFYWQRDLRGEIGPDGDWKAPGYDDGGWDTIPVPSVWELQGYSKPFYLCAFVNKQAVSTRKSEIPAVYADTNEAGIYRRGFSLPSAWEGKRVILHFGAAKSALEVHVNGVYAGWSQGSMTPAQFDITPLLRPGENQVTAVVYRYSTGYYLEDQDMWNFSGLYRDVYLVAEPEVCLYDIFADTSLTDNYACPTLEAAVTLRNSAKTRRVSVSLYMDNKLYASQSVMAEGDGCTEVKFVKQEFPDLRPWSAEEPNLYWFGAVLRDEDGKFLSKKRIRVGFRRVDIDGNVLKVNGRRVVLKGVNRHDFDPDHGWAVPRERYYDDLYLMKRAYINAIRTSHYPDDPFFYELCNELGFYVMDECDLETHGVRRKNCPGDNPRWRAAVCDRAERMVLRDRSHACVCIWSLGNEAGDGENFKYEREAILALDQSRPIHYEGDFTFKNSDFISRMYPSEKLVKQLRGQKAVKPGPFDNIANALAADFKPIPAAVYATHPVIYCEYAHAMENSLGNFREYVEDFYTYDHMCGGFIWDYVDQSIRANEKMPLPEGCMPGSWLYGGDFKEGASSYYFCANGIIGADRSLHPSYYEVKQVYANVLAEGFDPEIQRVTVRNRSVFSQLKEYEVQWKLRLDGETVQQGNLEYPDAGPGGCAEAEVPYDLSQVTQAGELILTISFHLRNTRAWAPAGYEMRFDQFILPSSQWKAPVIEPGEVLAIDKKGKTVTVASPNVTAVFERGWLCSLDFGDGELLTGEKRNGLRPNFFRALTDNDIGYLNFAPMFLRALNPLRLWKAVSRHIWAQRVKVAQPAPDQAQIKVYWNARGRIVSFPRNITTYTVHASGAVETAHRVRTFGFLPMLRVGMRCGLRRDLAQVKWYGRGPHESYCDRKTGQQLRLHECAAAELEHRYMRPQENGNRTDVRWVSFTREDGKGLRIDAACGGAPSLRCALAKPDSLSFSAGYYSQEKLDDAKHLYDLIADDYITLCIDGRQRGVGGDQPGAACLHAPYKLKPGKYSFGFTMRRAG